MTTIELVPVTTTEFFGVEYSRSRILVGYKATGTLEEQVASAIHEVEDALIDRISDPSPLVIRSTDETHAVAVNVAAKFGMTLTTK